MVDNSFTEGTADSGRMGIVDMSPPRDATDFANAIERLRDSNHVRVFNPGEWRLMLHEACLAISSLLAFEPVLFENWLYPVKGKGRKEVVVRAAWKSAPAKIMRLLKADIRDSSIRGWTKHRIVMVASPKTP